MKKKLFIPGPIDVNQDVLDQMSKSMIPHRSNEASELQKGISEKLQIVFNTKNQILLSTSSGSGLMEGAIRSCTRKKAAVFSSGSFGDKWYQMAVSNGVPADLYKVELGQVVKADMVEKALATGEYDLITITHNETSTGVMNPLEEISEVMKQYPDVVWCLDAVSSAAGVKLDLDKLGVDICITSTQKALGLPPGLAIASMSKKAYDSAKQVKNRGTYLDLLAIYDFTIKKNFQYPSTPNLSLMYALDFQLDRILEEGLDARYERHLQMAKFVREWAKDRFELFPNEEYASNTLTTVKNNRDIDTSKLIEDLKKENYIISNGYGNLRDKTFRISHMGDYTIEDLESLLETIDKIIK